MRCALTPWSTSSPAATGQPPRSRSTSPSTFPPCLGLQDNPGELAGYGPLPAPLARTLAADGRWRRMIVEPQTGALIDLGHRSYQPSAELARFVKTRDRSCIFPHLQPGRQYTARSTTTSATTHDTPKAAAPTAATCTPAAATITSSNTKPDGPPAPKPPPDTPPGQPPRPQIRGRSRRPQTLPVLTAPMIPGCLSRIQQRGQEATLANTEQDPTPSPKGIGHRRLEHSPAPGTRHSRAWLARRRKSSASWHGFGPKALRILKEELAAKGFSLS